MQVITANVSDGDSGKGRLDVQSPLARDADDGRVVSLRDVNLILQRLLDPAEYAAMQGQLDEGLAPVPLVARDAADMVGVLSRLHSDQSLRADLSLAEIYRARVRLDGRAIADVPDSARNQELCLEAVKNDPYAVKFLSRSQCTPEVCLEAVRGNGWVIEHLSMAQRTPAVYLAAVTQCGAVIKYINEASRTSEVCLTAVRQQGAIVRYIGDAQRTHEVCLACVAQDGDAVEHLTDAQRTPEVCLTAVRQESYAVTSLTAEQRTPEIWMAAIEQFLPTSKFLHAQDLHDSSVLCEFLLRHEDCKNYLRHTTASVLLDFERASLRGDFATDNS